MNSIGHTGILEFKPTVPISCIVNRRQLTFQIIGLTDDPLQVGFIVRFSDNVKFEISGNPSLVHEEPDETDEEVSLVKESDLTDYSVQHNKYLPYLRAIKYHLDDLISVMDSEWYQFYIKDSGGAKRVVWVAHHEEDDFPYSVFYFGNYQFSLKKENGIWESTCVRVMDSRTIDAKIVTLVSRQLDEITLK